MTRGKAKLSKSMSIEAFDNGYWYAVEIKAFARELKIPGAAKLRKDELETLIKHYLRTGRLKQPGRSLDGGKVVKDSERGLKLSLPVRVYTNNKETKDFIVREAGRMAPDFKEKSGARYRLNRWRETQIQQGHNITYRDLVRCFVELNATEGPFPQAPSGRYINFLSDYFAGEKTSNRDAAIAAWKQVKRLDVPKTYAAWKKHRAKK